MGQHARLPHSFLPENSESTDLETLFPECVIKCFFRKVNLIHLRIIFSNYAFQFI